MARAGDAALVHAGAGTSQPGRGAGLLIRSRGCEQQGLGEGAGTAAGDAVDRYLRLKARTAEANGRQGGVSPASGGMELSGPRFQVT